MKAKGFTIIELMIVLAILGTLAAMAAPAVSGYIEKKRLISAAEAVYGQLQYARSEAISRSADVFVDFSADGSATWSLGISTNSGCIAGSNCTLTVDGVLTYPGLSSADFPGISLGGSTAGTNVSFFGTGSQVQFNSVRGTASNGTVYLALGTKYDMQVKVSPVGRIKVCSPTGATNVPGYSTC